MNNPVVIEIVEAFGTEENPKTAPVPRSKVIEWMRTDDLEAAGALYHFVTEQQCLNRIEPHIEISHAVKFIADYYARCIKEDNEGDWADSRYSACWDFVNWFGGLWRDKSVPRKVLQDLKTWLTELYKSGDADIREAIVNGALEHLFETKEFAKFFADWKQDALLSKAYSDAMLWPEKGGSTQLGNPHNRKPQE